MQLNTVFLISGGWVQALQMLASLSILIALHEFGHFFFARLFKTRVEKFYLFFDFLFPFPNVLNFALFKKKMGDTEYGLGWFPLGGYVKIAGMVDESMDKEQMDQPPQPWEYRSKKAYQRLFIMLGGIIMNILLAIAIYAFVFGVYGEKYLPNENVVYGVAVDSTAERLGFRNGDKIVAVAGRPVERFDDVSSEIFFREAKTVTVQRDGQRVAIPLPEGTIRGMVKKNRMTMFVPRMPFVIKDVDGASEAGRMGLKPGDSLIAVNGQPVRFFDEFEKIKKASVEKPITLTMVRNGQVMDFKGTVPKTQRIGVQAESEKYFTLATKDYNLITAIGRGFTYSWEKFSSYATGFKMIFTSPEIKASESVGGLISFGKAFSPEFTWLGFLMMTALISVILAFMNLLPIPGLDGGYVIFLLFEMISGRKVSDKVMEKATGVGLILLLAVMLYANGMDIFRLFKK